MHSKRPSSLRVSASITLLASALLAACSGGGDAPAPDAAPPPGTLAISGRAVDGPLRGAIACYDIDGDGACDASEPRSAPSAADGSFRIDVPLAEAGRHAVVVEVPADAVDADTGSTVPRAFVMRAPATGQAGNQAVFVSPLTTLVLAHMGEYGATRDEAVAFVQMLGALEISPLADFTQAGGSAARQAARLARLVQLTANEQLAALAGAAGSNDLSGSPMNAADIAREAQLRLLSALPMLAGALTEPTLDAASGAALDVLLQVQARTLAEQAGPTLLDVRAATTVRRLAEPTPPATPEATGSMTALRYISADDWAMRTLQQSAEDTLPDAQGYQRYYDVRQQSVPNGLDGKGVVYSWATGNTRARDGDTHWNGSQWVDCRLGKRYLTRIRDAQGRGNYSFCDNLEQGVTVRRFVDISGQDMASVVSNQIRTFPGGSFGVNFRNWGPSNLALLQGARFPAGSSLVYQTNTLTSTAYAYDVQESNVVPVYNAAVAAGGDARITPALACNDPLQTANAAQVQAATLETLVARNRGTPCIYNPGGTAPNVTGATNRWWGNSSLNLGDVAALNTLPAGTGTYYNTTATLRVSFAATGNGALFHRCFRRASDTSPRNCSLLGLGSWQITTLGDARVLSFSVMPALAQRLGYARVFVERGGKVYYGYKNPVGESNPAVRLNLKASNAIALQLGLPAIRPVTQPGTATGARAATLATLKGTWGGASPDGTEATVLRFGDNGRFFIAHAMPPRQLTREQSGAELGWFDHDPATRRFSSLLEVDSNLTAGTSHPSLAEFDELLTITPTEITSSNGDVIPRLETSGANNSLVGMWAINSATDLAAAHLVFFSNGRFMLITHDADPQCAGANQCPPGVEFSEFSYDPATGQLLLFNLLYDTNGCDGSFATCPAGNNNVADTATVTIAPDGKTAALAAGGGFNATLYRIAAQ